MQKKLLPFHLLVVIIILTLAVARTGCASKKSKAKYLLVRLDSNGIDQHHFRDFDPKHAIEEDEATFNEFDGISTVHTNIWCRCIPFTLDPLNFFRNLISSERRISFA